MGNESYDNRRRRDDKPSSLRNLTPTCHPTDALGARRYEERDIAASRPVVEGQHSS